MHRLIKVSNTGREDTRAWDVDARFHIFMCVLDKRLLYFTLFSFFLSRVFTLPNLGLTTPPPPGTYNPNASGSNVWSAQCQGLRRRQRTPNPRTGIKIPPGIEPGPRIWKAGTLPTTPWRLTLFLQNIISKN